MPTSPKRPPGPGPAPGEEVLPAPKPAKRSTATAAPRARPKPPSARAAVRRERRRVAEALHNTICQDLTGICLMVSAAARECHVPHPEAERKLREIARLLQGAGAGLQEFVRTLRPGR